MSVVKFVEGKDIDFDKWDAVIQRDPYGNMYGYSWYLDMIVPEWHGLVAGDYESVMPLPTAKKFGLDYLTRPYGAQQLGIYSKDPISQELVNAFLSAIPKKYKWVDIYLNQHNPVEGISGRGITVTPQVNVELSLEVRYSSLFESYSKQTKRNLKKAQKFPLQLFEHDSPDVLVSLFQRNKGKTLSNLTEEHYSKIKHIMYVLMHKRKGYLWTAYDDRNSICAGIFFADIGNRVILLFSANDAYGKESHAITWLLDTYFQAKAGGNQIFDFEGSNIEGLKQFYLGFGGEALLYHRVIRNILPFPLRWLKSN
ncbi:MAG: hypothetical protein LAT76_01070 [Schleiferiaceae bacterium]|nr:hypothetical protein [Schleiferiaceae bacterium]